jgi:protein-disulfide isomerase
MKRYLPFVILGVVALLAFGGAVLFYRAKRRPAVTMSTKNLAEESGADEKLHVLGNPNAPITLEEFGDFECVSCGVLSEPINQLERDYRPKLRVIFHQAPSDIHPHAKEAALAAEAASMQGRFWAMHDLLYREQATWSKADDVRSLFNGYAAKLGLDVDRFKKDMAGEKCAERIADDLALAVASHVETTPMILINYWALGRSALNPDGVRKAVDAAVNGKPLPFD